MAGGIVSVFILWGLSALYKMFRYFIEVLCAGGLFSKLYTQMQLIKYIRILWKCFSNKIKLYKTQYNMHGIAQLSTIIIMRYKGERESVYRVMFQCLLLCYFVFCASNFYVIFLYLLATN